MLNIPRLFCAWCIHCRERKLNGLGFLRHPVMPVVIVTANGMQTRLNIVEIIACICLQKQRNTFICCNKYRKQSQFLVLSQTFNVFVTVSIYTVFYITSVFNLLYLCSKMHRTL